MSTDLVKYSVIPANQDVSDRFDADNFYEYDTSDFDGLLTSDDIEFSEAFGDKFRDAFGKVKGAFSRKDRAGRTRQRREGGLFSGIKSKLEDFRAGAEDRATGRATRFDARMTRRQKRKDERLRRRNVRQAMKIQSLPENTQKGLDDLGNNPKPDNQNLSNSIDNTKAGTGTTQDESLTDQATNIVNEAISAGVDPADIGVVIDTSNPQNPTVEPDMESKWKLMSTGAKVGIIGGGVVVAGLIVFAIVKASKR